MDERTGAATPPPRSPQIQAHLRSSWKRPDRDNSECYLVVLHADPAKRRGTLLSGVHHQGREKIIDCITLKTAGAVGGLDDRFLHQDGALSDFAVFG